MKRVKKNGLAGALEKSLRNATSPIPIPTDMALTNGCLSAVKWVRLIQHQ
jgi:hypothetical protein